MLPGTQIAPHHGACNIKLRCHFPLFVPEDGAITPPGSSGPQCYLRVGHETKTWKEGEMIVFDDTYDHEAGNLTSTGSERVVLLIDIWHPELEIEERHAI